MTTCAVQINFDLNIDAASYRAACEHALPQVQAADGLLVKLWLQAPEGTAGGGLYVFRDRAAAEAYLASPFMQQLRGAPSVHNFTVRISDVLLDLSARTGGTVLRAA